MTIYEEWIKGEAEMSLKFDDTKIEEIIEKGRKPLNMEINKLTIQTKANLLKRIFAGLIDYLIIFGFTFLMLHFFGVPNDEGGYSLKGLPALSTMLFWFGWTIGAEQYFGRTFGNYTQNLSVLSIKDENTKLTFGQSFKRHFIDMIDLWPLGILGILLIKNTKYNQRLGDLWAKTIVIDTTDITQNVKFGSE